MANVPSVPGTMPPVETPTQPPVQVMPVDPVVESLKARLLDLEIRVEHLSEFAYSRGYSNPPSEDLIKRVTNRQA
jgi:hypothetical protein